MKPREATNPPAYQGPDARAVRQMFSEIAPRYDFLNHFLSASIDRHWRRIAVRKVAEFARQPGRQRGLDLCCGTGDLALALHRGLDMDIVASDFCHPMLTRSNSKIAAAALGNRIRTVEADALSLPFASESFDAITNAFGLRNLQDPAAGLSEMLRLLTSGGVAVILEFSKPVVPVFREAFQFYFRNVLPRLGSLISGQSFAYQYLPDSVRKFPSQQELAGIMQAVGFRAVEYRNLTGGIAALHWGMK
jgi:demethylmenaquinone methyltransferase/2-methoxy-6-polyprenyl-1,4-benzoquinol methylase